MQKISENWKLDKEFVSLFSYCISESKNLGIQADIYLEKIINALHKEPNDQNQQEITVKKISGASKASDSKVYLLIGETGQGKSTFVNYFAGKQLAKEGKGLRSETAEIFLYKLPGYYIIDTPGLFDTRKEMKNENIMGKIIGAVREELNEASKIDAIILIWNPVKTERFRFDEILKNIEDSLGSDALDSLMILINKVSNRWFEENREAALEFLEELSSQNSIFPVVVGDLKDTSRELIEKINNTSNQCSKFKENVFREHRLETLHTKFKEYKEKEKRKEAEIEERLKPGKEIVINDLKEKFELRKSYLEKLFSHQDKILTSFENNYIDYYNKLLDKANSLKNSCDQMRNTINNL